MSTESDPNLLQWIANTAGAGVMAIGGLLFKSFSDRLKALEKTHKNLVSNEYLDNRLDEITEERRWMHQQNAERLDALTDRIDKVLMK